MKYLEIHPTKDKQCRVVNRGCPKDPTQLALNSQGMLSNTKDRNESKNIFISSEKTPPLQVASKNKPVRYDLGEFEKI